MHKVFDCPRSKLSPIVILIYWFIALAELCAQTGGTGKISGRVFNPVTQQYVANAEIRVKGTNLAAASASDGAYQIDNVPAGAVTVEVVYTGYSAEPTLLNVSAGQTATRDFTLVSTQALKSTTAADGTIKLTEFVVSSEREGNAKAIMSQKRNMNVTTSVASDIFGDVTDGNVGEFLKFLPGVDVDYVESETRGPRLGGMDAQYVGVSFDGVRLASADANRTGDLGGATSFEAFSISSIESIEISRTTSPDMDADSPAGTINMKTRRAFDRKGRRIGYSTSLNLNSEEFTLSKTYGPSTDKNYKARPNYSFEYSDVLLDRRLGVVASFSHVDSFTEQYRHNLTYNKTVTTADPRPMVATALNFKDGAKNIAKDTYTATVDFKATPRLTLSATTIYNYALGQFFNRELTFNAGTNNTNAATGRTNVLGDGINNVSTNGLATNTSRNQVLAGGNASKETITFTFYPRFEYKLGGWVADGGFAFSRSNNNYEGIEEGHARSSDTNSIASDWTASRSGVNSYEWTIQQTSGPSWFDLYNRTNPRITNEGRYANTELYTGDVNFKWATPIRRFPVVVKFGGKWNEEGRKNGNETSYSNWSYIGPGGNTLTGFNATTGAPIITTNGSWGAYPNPNFWSTGTTNILTVKDSSGAVQSRSIPRVDDSATASLFRSRPDYFVNIATADNYYNAFIAPRRDMVRTITAAYLMADVKFSQRLSVRTGLRGETTESDFTEFDARTKAEILAAGYAINTTTGNATTIDGYRFQYQSKPRIHRRSDYTNLFPMMSLKYTISDNLQFHTGYNQAISRPPVDHITGPWTANEDTLIVTSPNPNLLPEYSKNFAARLAYYFEPAGQLSATITQNTIRNLRELRTGTAEEFGLEDDPVYGSYRFTTRFNVPNPVRFRNLELAYSQTLPFEAELLRAITVNLSYTRTYASQRRDKLLPHRFTSSLGYRYKRFSSRLGIVWRADSADTSDIYGRYRRHDTKYDLGGEFRLTKYASLFFQGRNIFNDGQTWMETPTANIEGQGAAIRVYENYGANWNFGVKGTF